MVCNDFGHRGPVLECPLGVQRPLGPCDDGGFLVGHGVKVLKSVRNVFSVDLGIEEKLAGDVEIHRVCEGLLSQELTDVRLEVY